METQSIVVESNPNVTFQYVGLHEPEKEAVLSWHPPTPAPPRQALVITRFNKQTRKSIVDLSTRSIASSHLYTGSGYPLFTFEEQVTANLLPLKYGPFKASIKKRKLKLPVRVSQSGGSEKRKLS